jgi:hypothetical protein
MKISSYLMLSLALALPALNTQCASARIDKEEKAALTGLRVPAPTTEKNSLTTPAVMSNKTAGTIGLVSGLTGGLVGAAIGTAAVAASDSSYKTRNASAHQPLLAPGRYAQQQMLAAMTAELKKTAFFGPKISPSGSHTLNIALRQYGLQNLSGKEGHGPSILALVSIVDANGDAIYKRAFVMTGADATPEAVAPLATYLQQPQLLENHFQITCQALAADIAETLTEATAE